MSFTSFNFLVFITIVIGLYYVVPKKYQWCILLLASYTFYIAGGIDNLLYIVCSTVFTFLSGRYMQKLRDDFQDKLTNSTEEFTKEQRIAMKKEVQKQVHRVQVITALINLSVLIYFKFLNFFIDNLNDFIAIFEWDASIPVVNVLAPLGLSYYTFNSIGYLIDVGRGKHAAESNLGKFALFISFFPSIVQGPLFRYNDVGMQLQQSHDFDYKNFTFGAQLVLWGFFKKLVLADRIGIVASTIFSPEFGTDYNGSQILFGVLAYSFQIYGDFSGGTDITRGVAQMMGINLPMNFARPFFANTLGDFWRRWHMSLGAWMREFVFYPIMLSKPVTAVSKKFRAKFGPHAGKMVPSVAAPMVVFFLIGIWHGLTWQYFCNGLYHALLISSGVALGPVFKWITDKLKIDTESFAWRLFQIIRTNILISISRIIVKAPSLGDAVRMIKTMFTSVDMQFLTGANGLMFTYGLGKRELLLVLACIVLLFIIGIMQERGVEIRETLAKQNIVIRWGILLLLLAVVLVFGVYGPEYDAASFIYGNF